MNARYVIDAIFHAATYSHLPLLILQQNQPLFLVDFVDTPERLAWRWFVNDGLAFVYFLIYQHSGLRNRHVMWHMEKNNILSGFHPYEVLGTCLYFSIFLCIPTELILLWWPNESRFLTNEIWISHLIQRMNLMFLIACMYHIVLEKIGLNSILRARYFGLEFLE